MWARQQLQIGTDLHHAHVDQRLVQFLLVVRRPLCSHTILPHTQNSYHFYSLPPSLACHYIIFHLKVTITQLAKKTVENPLSMMGLPGLALPEVAILMTTDMVFIAAATLESMNWITLEHSSQPIWKFSQQ